ncbi:baseplate J/gp47 family protein [Lelliottia wanjuensis]|uniref:baseplate J/gp47 family protein n=1 Tax=Lelliottia wanjuensis TaxID=3050585 RepID=UPI00254A4A4E|nr:baseplate J/gp47 family protein [Lelliottia sp. V106_16]MDK9356686.1 baseplate J/gp47 family protein [Lelliottia sp. V106_16]
MADSDFYRPPLPDLITQIRNDILSRFQQDEVLRRANAEVYSRAVAAAVNSLYGYLDYLSSNILPDLADETWLYRHGNLKKCPRKDPIAATGWARWDGVLPGIPIYAGTELQRDDQVTFVTTADTVSADGVLRVPVECEIAGVNGNTDDGISLNLVSPVSGLSSRAVADSIKGGDDLEDVEQWRARIIDRWWYIPQSGADPDYIEWAESIPGISRAWTFRNWQGPGTVGVMCATDDINDPVPTEIQLQSVEDYIKPKSPVAGSALYVFGPDVRTIDFNIVLYPDSFTTRVSVIKEINAFLQREGQPLSTLFLSRINEAISAAEGEFSHILIYPNENINLGDTELPVSGDFIWGQQSS